MGNPYTIYLAGLVLNQFIWDSHLKMGAFSGRLFGENWSSLLKRKREGLPLELHHFPQFAHWEKENCGQHYFLSHSQCTCENILPFLQFQERQESRSSDMESKYAARANVNLHETWLKCNSWVQTPNILPTFNNHFLFFFLQNFSFLTGKSWLL